MRILLFFFALPLLHARADDWTRELSAPPVQKVALSLARTAMRTFLRHGATVPVPSNLPAALMKRGAVFVTVEKQGQIQPRGCRGTLRPSTRNLAEEIVRNAIAACSRDRRVAPLRLSELPLCRISLTVVLKVQPIASLRAHDAERNGLVVRDGSHIGIVLPFEGRDSGVQLKWAKQKAGLNEHAQVQLYELFAVRFRETGVAAQKPQITSSGQQVRSNSTVLE